MSVMYIFDTKFRQNEHYAYKQKHTNYLKKKNMEISAYSICCMNERTFTQQMYIYLIPILIYYHIIITLIDLCPHLFKHYLYHWSSHHLHNLCYCSSLRYHYFHHCSFHHHHHHSIPLYFSSSYVFQIDVTTVCTLVKCVKHF